MGDLDVDFFLETLEQLMKSSKYESINKEKPQLESLKEEINYLRVFLRVTEKKRNDQSEVMNLVRKIKDVVSKAENIVERFVVHASNGNHAHFFSLRRRYPSLHLESVKREIKTLTATVKQIYDENLCDVKLDHSFSENEGGSSSSSESNTSEGTEEKVVIGFKEEVKTLLEMLHDSGESGQLEIVSIVGAAGGGKTTLAREVYDHPLTSHIFEVRAWVNISPCYDKTMKRNLLISILRLVSPNRDYKKSNENENELGEHVLKFLKGKKYLIVMDNVWSIEAWNNIQISLPRDCYGSKVLFTSQIPVEPNKIHCILHYLAPLSRSCSWELLQKKVFGKKSCPPELVGMGKHIAEKCEGLPLAIIAIAGVLMENRMLNVWEEISTRLNLIMAESQYDCMKILEISYNYLPLHLKACFCYIGGFPKKTEILVRELIWLWIAEGFIQQSEGAKSLEDIAKDYLNNLIERNLVLVASRSSCGGIKTCHIHDLLRQLCLEKAEEDHFLMQLYRDDTFSPSAAMKHRRLFIGSQFFCESFFKPHARNLRSLLYLSLQSSDQFLFESDLSFFVENFELLRVLCFESFLNCQGEIGRGNLVNLRYLALKISEETWDFEVQFSFLLNLETLYIKSPSDTNCRKNILLPRNIFEMVKLRHLYTKEGIFNYHHSCRDHLSKLENLQTLNKICPCQVCRIFLERTPNLRKLGFWGELTPNDDVWRLPNLEFLKYLETLSFTSTTGFGNKTIILASVLRFPPTITQLTFKNTWLSWEGLSIIQTLQSLEVLKLLMRACHGPIWCITEQEGFSRLKYLRLQGLDIEELDASEDQFPRLEVLVVRECVYLEQIPIDFANINKLCEIEVTRSTQSVEKSAMKIQKERKNTRGVDGCINICASSNYAEVQGYPNSSLARETQIFRPTLPTGGSSSSGKSNTLELEVVGFKEEVRTLMEKLHDDCRPLEIIAIIGAAGGGKTTLAREVYEHRLTSHTFEVRAWVTVSQDYHYTMRKNLLIPILESASSAKSGDYEKSSEDKLKVNIYECLKGKRYLIVMDDMWGIEAWNDIQLSFPKECTGSKVLFTSRMSVEPSNISYLPHRLNPLSKSDSWELFQKKVFRMRYCPMELVGSGKHIVEKCEGLPLAIVTIAGILAVKDKTLESWKEVGKNLSSTIAKNQDGCMKILELSYNHLPLHLRLCFLYMGGFPKDSEILVRELIWFWIAEGFIQQSKEDKSLENVAKGYLSSLIDRNLVMEATRRSSGEIKTCRINDLLHELCLKKAEEDNFVVQIYKDDAFSPSATFKHQRLFIGSRFFNELSLMPCMQNLRSFLCLDLEKSSKWGFQPSLETNLSFFDKNFEPLRVLSLMSSICRGKIERGHLINLRYLALRHPFSGGDIELPFSNLFNLETLHLRSWSSDTQLQSIPLPRDILKMVKLRHLYAKGGVFEYHPRNSNGRYSYYPESSSKLETLQTLSKICPCNNCRKFLERTPNLRNLGFSGVRRSSDDNFLYEDVNADLEFLRCLETLTIRRWFMFDFARGHAVPLDLKFPPTLTQLTLESTFLSWRQLTSLQALPSLEVLKLLFNACDGKIWDTSQQEGFSQLKYLRLEGLNIEEWDAIEDQFPRLEVLVVKFCRLLKHIPIEIANLYELQKIEVTGCHPFVEESARKIQEELINNRGDGGGINLFAEDNVYEYI